jgi:alpha-glucosidase
VLSSHDVPRHQTRLMQAITGDVAGRRADPVEPVAGLRRARAATLLMLALPGSAYLYQGEELGLPEVLDLPDSVRQDPAFHRATGQDGYRDGCRVPLPWSGSEPPYGFGPGDSWLPQPSQWASLSVAAQKSVPGSTLSLYRRALALRRAIIGDLEWRDEKPGILAFRRGDFECIVNLGVTSVPIDGPVLLASSPVDDVLPPDTTIWRTLR